MSDKSLPDDEKTIRVYGYVCLNCNLFNKRKELNYFTKGLPSNKKFYFTCVWCETQGCWVWDISQERFVHKQCI